MTYNVIKHIALLAFTAIALIIALPIVRAQTDLIPEATLVAQADTEPPSDVENVEAVPGSSQVALTWNVATDNNFVAGYKVYYGTESVEEPSEEYNMGFIDVGNKISYDVTGLENGTVYYFAVTAYDNDGNESENYSVEVSATPLHGAADGQAPTVVSAEAPDEFTVLVTFSEAVNLPAEAKEAFTIVEDGTGVTLEVLSASMDVSDSTNTTVVVTTATQTASTAYILTAGIEITDLEGNPIESGTSDTALFLGFDPDAVGTGSSLEDEAVTDTEGPELIDITAPSPTTVLVTFSEPVVLAPNPIQNFVITKESDSNDTLPIAAVSLSGDELQVTLTTAEQEPINYFLIAIDIADKQGNLLDSANNAAAFAGFGASTTAPPVTPEAPSTDELPSSDDTLAPEDVSNFAAKLLQNMVVQLTWGASPNTAGDLVEYILYRSTDGEVYGSGVTLASTALSHEVSGLAAGTNYYYKLTARDTAGNESEGVITAFMLPETGPELALLALGSLGAGRFLTRRKKNRK